jgi:uncharacterized protein
MSASPMSAPTEVAVAPIVDGHVHIGEGVEAGGFGHALLETEGLLELMAGPFDVLGTPRRIDRCLVQPNIFITRAGDPADSHRYVADAVRDHPDRLIGCFVANPLLPVQRTLEVAEELVAEHGFRALKLHPSSHGYDPPHLRRQLEPILDLAQRLDLPVIVHQGDPPFAHPTRMAPLIEDFPHVSFILAHFGCQRVVLASEAIYVASKNPNVYLETGWGALPRLKEGLAELGAGRLIFGSDCPIQEIGSQLRVLEALTWRPPIGVGLTHHEFQQIVGGTLCSLIRT